MKGCNIQIPGKTPGRKLEISGKRLSVTCVRDGELLHDAPAPPAHPEEAPQRLRRLHRAPLLAHAVPGRGPPADELAGPRLQVCVDVSTR